MTYYLMKIGMFAAFVALLYYAVGLATGMASSFVSSHFALGNNAIYILHKLKICTAVNIYLSAVIGSWIVNKIINYWG